MRDFAKLHAGAGLQDVPGKAGVALLAGAGLAWLGPFGTVDQSMFVRLGFWTAMSVAWFALSTGVSFMLSRSARLRRMRRWEQRLLTIAVASIPGVLIAGLALVRMQNWRPDLVQVIDLFTQTMLIGSVLELISFALLERGAGERAEQSVAVAPEIDGGDPPGAPLAPFEALDGSSQGTEQRPANAFPVLLMRVPLEVRGTIVCLQMEDHYVRIHTVGGSALVLMRLSDAISELGDVPGLRVHRSWWVANDGISEVTRKGRTAQLRLINDLIVPVSQPYLTSVAALSGRANVAFDIPISKPTKIHV